MWTRFLLVAAMLLCACSPSSADDISVKADGNTTRKITVKVENGNRNLLGRLFNRDRASRAPAPASAGTAGTVLLIPTVAIPALPLTTLPQIPEGAGQIKVVVERK